MKTRRTVPAIGLAGAVLAGLLAGCAVRDEPPVSAAPAAPAAPVASADQPSGGGPVVTIGDSVMAGLGLDPGAAWPDLMAADTGADVVNLACSGAGFTIAGDCDQDFGDLVSEAIALDPSVVIIQSSDNDVDADEDDIAAATAAAIDRLRAALPDTQIIGIGTLWEDPSDEPDAIAWSSDALEDAVDADGGVFISIGQPLQDDPDLLQWDGEHPTEAGQAALEDAVATALQRSGVAL